MFSIISGKQNRRKEKRGFSSNFYKMLSQQGLQDPLPFPLMHFQIDYPITPGEYDLTGTQKEGKKEKKICRVQPFQNYK